MARKHNLEKAATDFDMACYVAQDGMMVEAAILARRGCEHLAREWARRAPLRQGTGFETLSLAAAVELEIARRKAIRRAS